MPFLPPVDSALVETRRKNSQRENYGDAADGRRCDEIKRSYIRARAGSAGKGDRQLQGGVGVREKSAQQTNSAAQLSSV